LTIEKMNDQINLVIYLIFFINIIIILFLIFFI